MVGFLNLRVVLDRTLDLVYTLEKWEFPIFFIIIEKNKKKN